jgi:hypothetical protein
MLDYLDAVQGVKFTRFLSIVIAARFRRRYPWVLFRAREQYVAIIVSRSAVTTLAYINSRGLICDHSAPRLQLS